MRLVLVLLRANFIVAWLSVRITTVRAVEQDLENAKKCLSRAPSEAADAYDMYSALILDASVAVYCIRFQQIAPPEFTNICPPVYIHRTGHLL